MERLPSALPITLGLLPPAGKRTVAVIMMSSSTAATLRLATSWRGHRFFTGAGIVVQSRVLKFQDIRFENSTSVFQITGRISFSGKGFAEENALISLILANPFLFGWSKKITDAFALTSSHDEMSSEQTYATRGNVVDAGICNQVNKISQARIVPENPDNVMLCQSA